MTEQDDNFPGFQLKRLLHTHGTVLRFLISGGTAAAVDLSLLYYLTEHIGIHYLVSAGMAFLVAFVVSFILQKFWTFTDTSMEKVSLQAFFYFVVCVANFFLNLFLMYVFVEKAHLWYLASQALAGGLIAISSFVIYRKFIFVRSHPHS